MQFPNAANGSGKIFVGEVLSLIFAICTGIATLLAAFAVSTVDSASSLIDSATTSEDIADAFQAAADASSTALGSIAGAGLLIAIGAIIGLIGFILVMVGCGQAGKEEANFKTALIVYVVMIALTCVGSFFAANSNVVKTIVTAANTFCSLYAFFLIIKGFTNLANNMGNKEVEEKGNSTFKTVAVLVIANAILTMVGSLIGGTIGGILVLVGLLASMIYFIMFIGFVGKAKNMLKGLS